MSFVFWLGQALEHAGCESVPAKDTRAAWELVREHKVSVDILVVNPFLDGAMPFIDELRQSRHNLKVIAALPESSEGPIALAGFDAMLPKPAQLTPEARIQWVDCVRGFETNRRSAH